MEHKGLLEVRNLKKYFDTNRGPLQAVDNISFSIEKGRTLGVVGESGCGKSTLGRTILRLQEPTSGEIWFNGEDIVKYDKKQVKALRSKMQIIFQDPYSSLNPRMTVSQAIEAPLVLQGIYKKNDREGLQKKVREMMDLVGLAYRFANSYPHELDGGRRQRIGIARALALNPEFVVCDEPVSALDVSVRAQVLNLMRELKEKENKSLMLITHDMGVVAEMADDVMVMYAGKEMEYGDVKSIFKHPLHPYTQGLLKSIPRLDQDSSERLFNIPGSVPDLSEMPKGCRFCTRCTEACSKCFDQEPGLYEIGEQKVRCWKYAPEGGFGNDGQK